jgi:hypothetical protein
MKTKEGEVLPELNDGEWTRPRRSGWIHECCDCGLRHKVSFKLVRIGENRREILFKWERLNKKHGKK